MLDEPLVPLPTEGRVYRAHRRVRLADAGLSGRLRLDACARYLQDIGNDDTADSGIDGEAGAWVVRRAVIDVVSPPRWGERVDLATWCGGVGRRWAERRLTMAGEDGGTVEMTTLWVHLDPETGVPAKLPASFMDLYGAAAGGRTVTSRLWLSPPDDRDGGQGGDGTAAPGPREVLPWPLRTVDYDLMHHVNNAAYWAAVEEVLAVHDHPLRRQPARAVLEYGPGITVGAQVELLVGTDRDQELDIWFMVDGTALGTARLLPLPVAVTR